MSGQRGHQRQVCGTVYPCVHSGGGQLYFELVGHSVGNTPPPLRAEESATKHAAAKVRLEAFIAEIEAADWHKLSDIIEAYPTADVITGKRFVFNIKGNQFRLVADIDFKRKLFFAGWFGTHANYDKLDVLDY